MASYSERELSGYLIKQPENSYSFHSNDLAAQVTEIPDPIGSIGCRKTSPEKGSASQRTGFIQDDTSEWLPKFLQQRTKGIQWLIEPFLPKGGIVLLHGPKSVGKSPLTWRIARCVSDGDDFFGYPVQSTGPVLYFELDTPASQVHPRLSRLEKVPSKMFLRVPKHLLDFPMLAFVTPGAEESKALHELNSTVKPALVIVNTLRKSHREDDKESHTPSRVYAAFQHFFPSATILAIHHDRKDPVDLAQVNPDQMFSGSQAWANDAQVVLHLTRSGNKKLKQHVVAEGDAPHVKTEVSLKLTGSQVSDHELYHPLILQLSTDGTNWIETGPIAYRKFFRSLDITLPRADRITLTMEKFDVGKSAVYEACRGLS